MSLFISAIISLYFGGLIVFPKFREKFGPVWGRNGTKKVSQKSLIIMFVAFIIMTIGAALPNFYLILLGFLIFMITGIFESKAK